MGWDISAWVEVKMPWMEAVHDLGYDVWYPVVDASILLGRDYDMFGCLFGLRNYGHFTPVAANRGIPDDVSERVREESRKYLEADPEYGCVSPSWVTWDELEAIDWEEPALDADQRLHEFVKDERGEWVYDTKAAWSGDFGREFSYDIELPPWKEGQEWQVGDRLFRAMRLRRRDVLTNDWQALFDIMRVLARAYTPDGVRLVVWFSS